MGYRINLSNANCIGHLIEGNIVSFLNQTLIDENYLEGNLLYLDDMLSPLNEDFISSDRGWFYKNKSDLFSGWSHIRDLIRRMYYTKQERINHEDKYLNESRVEIEIFLSNLSNLLGRYQYKYLVLPGFEHNTLNNSLINKNELLYWLRAKSNYSYLIIQLKEIPQKQDVQILNSFKHFELALHRIDEWPGVLVWRKGAWNRSEGLFIPINDSSELKYIIEAQSFERDYFNLLKRDFGQRRKFDNAQLIHLSDLHIGLRNETSKIIRLITILEKYRNQIDSNIELYPLITGDLLDNPTTENLMKYNDFLLKLNLIGLEKPISVLGNHDSNLKGILRSDKKIKSVLSNLATEEHLKIIEELKLIIIKFDSNTDGQLAQGKIGMEQLTLIGNQLDKIPNLNTYCIIGMLHHHPFEMDRPEWIKRTWYEAIFGDYAINRALKLVDSDTFIEWINKRNIKFLIHGHKHIPLLFNQNDINIISAGSSTGNIEHINPNKTFLTYNIINYDKNLNKPTSSTIVFEDLLGSGTSHYQIMKY